MVPRVRRWAHEDIVLVQVEEEAAKLGDSADVAHELLLEGQAVRPAECGATAAAQREQRP